MATTQEQRDQLFVFLYAALFDHNWTPGTDLDEIKEDDPEAFEVIVETAEAFARKVGYQLPENLTVEDWEDIFERYT